MFVFYVVHISSQVGVEEQRLGGRKHVHHVQGNRSYILINYFNIYLLLICLFICCCVFCPSNHMPFSLTSRWSLSYCCSFFFAFVFVVIKTVEKLLSASVISTQTTVESKEQQFSVSPSIYLLACLVFCNVNTVIRAYTPCESVAGSISASLTPLLLDPGICGTWKLLMHMVLNSSFKNPFLWQSRGCEVIRRLRAECAQRTDNRHTEVCSYICETFSCFTDVYCCMS